MIDDMETTIELFKYYVSIIGEIPGSMYFSILLQRFLFLFSDNRYTWLD